MRFRLLAQRNPVDAADSHSRTSLFRYILEYLALEPREQQGFTLTLQQVPEPKIAKNRMHLDLLVPDLQAEVARIESLGATRLTPAPLEQYGQRWFVMRDPEGNEFCLGLEPTQ